MIAPMLKAAVITQEKDAQETVVSLRRLGVLHVGHVRLPQAKDILLLQEELTLLVSCEEVWDWALPQQKQAAAGRETICGWKEAARHISDLGRRYEQLGTFVRGLRSAINEWEQWGDFDPQLIDQLAAKGVYLKLYQVPLEEIAGLRGEAYIKVIFTAAGIAHCVVVSTAPLPLDFKEVPLPKHGLNWMKQRLQESEAAMEVLRGEIAKTLVHRPCLLVAREQLKKELEFQQVVAGMGREGKLAYVSGFIPADQQAMLFRQAREKSWGVQLSQPGEEDIVPTLIRAPRWVSLIKPVFKLLEILPGYRELDVSPLFLIFFSLFFGILIGDAGYGVVYLLLTLWLEKKKGVNPRAANIFPLFYLLTSCAIVWGILTGTFFGQDWLAASGIKPLLPALNRPAEMQAFCFFLGALHLSLAHAWRALIKFPGQAFLADLGWIGVLWVAYAASCALILGRAFPGFGLPLAALGMLLVLFFSEPRRNVFKRMGAGFTAVTFGLSFMSAFTDVVSYVRLFAVGLAGVAIANTTNAMAAGLGSGAAGISAGILIRFVGHGLNLVLGPIAILVHGVRLNVLEFGLNHTGLTWSGVAYKPLIEQAA